MVRAMVRPGRAAHLRVSQTGRWPWMKPVGGRISSGGTTRPSWLGEPIGPVGLRFMESSRTTSFPRRRLSVGTYSSTDTSTGASRSRRRWPKAYRVTWVGFIKLERRRTPSIGVHQLHTKGVISAVALDAFMRIWGNDRNTFHHLNEDVPTGYEECDRRAEECVKALLTIESELFAFGINEGRIVPKSPIYWPKSDAEHADVFFRLSGH